MRFDLVNYDEVVLDNQSIRDSISQFVKGLVETMINKEFEIFISRNPLPDFCDTCKIH